MNQSIALLLAFILLIRSSRSLSDPINVGSKYLMSSEVTGDDYYLGCGNDQLCSILSLSDAEEHDGWTVNFTGSYWQFIIRDDSWALDVQNAVKNIGQTSGELIFANQDTTISPGFHQGQLWDLESWPDGTYQLRNVQWNGPLDVDSNITPFVNQISDSSLKGQYWYFRSVQPQTTTTVVTTVTTTVNSFASSTTTITTMVCPQKRAEVNGTPLYKRQQSGPGILDTTTQTSVSTVVTTTTETTSTSVYTSTETVTSCQPITTASTSVSTAVSVSTVVSVSTGISISSTTQSAFTGSLIPSTTQSVSTKISVSSITLAAPPNASHSSANIREPSIIFGLFFTGIFIVCLLIL